MDADNLINRIVIHNGKKGKILNYTYLDYSDLRNDKPLFRVLIDKKEYSLYKDEFTLSESKD